MKDNAIKKRISLFFTRLWHNEAFCRCAARAVLVFFIVYGSMQAFLSCFDIYSYNFAFVLFFSLGIAVYVSSVFYSEKRKNLMYLILLAFFLIMTFLFGRYTNSGFYAIVNIIYKRLEVELDLAGIIEYTERYTNRYMTITVSLVFISFGMSVLVNLVISNTMSFMDVFFSTSIPLMLALYFGYKPAPLYAWMLMSGYTAVYILGRSRKFRYKSLLKRRREKRDSKKNIFYADKMSDGKMMFCVVGASSVFTLCVLLVVGTVFADFNFDTGEKWAEYKETTDYYAKTFITYGIWGFNNEYDSAGGVNNGELGGVAAVRPDYQTDIKVTYTPYSYNPVYLRSYVGLDYTGRSWLPIEEYRVADTPKYIEFDETQTLKQSYEAGDEHAAVGKMQIENIDGGNVGYLPYYAGEHKSKKSSGMISETEVEYYIPNEDAKSEQTEEPDDRYTYVNSRNKEALVETCRAAGITKNDSRGEITQKLKFYFQENYPYTMRPGKTPRNEDFVNYFLTKQKKGLCTHYASAATLIYRSLGIPARYVEGYVFSYGDVQGGDLVRDENYADWYDGYNAMGETAVVSVELNDVHAHAWTEVYDEDFGWVTVDLTPTTLGAEAEDDKDFWEVFNKWMGSDDNTQEDTEDTANGNAALMRGVYGFATLIVLTIVGIVLLFSYKNILGVYKLHKSFNTKDKCTNIINRYKYVCSLVRKKQSDFNKCESHSEQLEFLISNFDIQNYDIAKFAEVIEEISYGRGVEIEDGEYSEVAEFLKVVEHKVRRWKRKRR